MQSGPSKEELENYWKTSRAYFDELAEHYKTADPEYYEKFIVPFYGFGASLYKPGSDFPSAGVRKSSPALSIAISVALLLIGLIAGLVMMLIR